VSIGIRARYASMVRSALVLVLVGCSGAPATPPAVSEPVSSAAPTPTVAADPVVSCPAGTRYEDDVCKPLVVIDCPSGTRFEEGVGCVARVNDPPPPPSSAFVLPNTPPPPPRSRCNCLPADILCARSKCNQPGGFQPMPQPEPLRATPAL
jgi:hypothetical protein